MKEENFLGAILATPDDTTLRLAYADWLEERDDPRYELVRVCEAMRRVPVWSDRYWGLKTRRNELWAACPLGWLEATGYDGSRYDPVFRDGVPGGWRERWRLIREFTERWHGVAVPDIGGWRPEVRQVEERLGLALPPSAREYVAYAHDLREYGTPGHDPRRAPAMLFHCALYQLERLVSRAAVSMIYYTLDDSTLGVALEDLGADDPGTIHFRRDEVDAEIGGDGVPVEVLVPGARQPFGPSLTQSVFRHLFIELPTAGWLEVALDASDEFLSRLTEAFPVHARFDDADVYEGDEMLALVSRARDGGGGLIADVVIRRPVLVASVPAFLYETGQRRATASGMLGPAAWRRQQEEELRRPGARQPPRWVSVPRRNLEPEAQQPLPAPPLPQHDDDVPF
jgi:uncharacterized protein (TIGR02996 family)